jgi:4,5-DOPA dioxygenase extradiol
MNGASADRLPAFFFGHGSPMNALERNRYTDAWRDAVVALPRPRAILAVSAHWYVRGTRVTAQARPPTIHDFGGFPPELHAFDYPAPGDPALAARVCDLLAPDPVRLDEGWGLDHGTWSVLAHAFPEADVPVVQLALDGTAPPHEHLALARRLRPLRDEGVLIVGTGNVVHNLRAMRREPAAPAFDWAVRFEERVTAAALAGDDAALIDLDAAGRDAAASVPTPEHYLPFLYAYGAGGGAAAVVVRGIEAASIGMLAMRFD